MFKYSSSINNYCFILVGIIVFFCNSVSCSNKEIKYIVERMDDLDVTKLKNTSVILRSRDKTSNQSVYFINKYKGSCSPYVVEVNEYDLSSVRINNDLVLKSCQIDYFSNERIIEIIKEYFTVKVRFLQVDSCGNIFSNPNAQSTPIFIKKNCNNLIIDNDFRDIGNNWFVKEQGVPPQK